MRHLLCSAVSSSPMWIAHFRFFYDAIPIRNIDLIYGLPNQTEASLRESISYVVSRGANGCICIRSTCDR